MRVLGLPDEDFLFRVEEALEILPSFELSPPSHFHTAGIEPQVMSVLDISHCRCGTAGGTIVIVT